MKILITGANGFIGQALCKKLSESHQVFAMARSFKQASTTDNLVQISHDMTQPLNQADLPDKIDAVIHLAQSSQYRSFPDGMRDMISVNILGLTDVLDYAKEAGCEYFVNFSSGSVYDPSQADQSETAQLLPKAAYPLTKHMSESLVALYTQYFKTLSLRLFFPYGPGQEGMLVPNLVNSVKSNNTVNLQGNEGGLEICPILVDDVIEVCERLLVQQTDGIINIAGYEQLRLKTIVQEIGEAVEVEPNFEIDANASPALFRPSLEKMKSLMQDYKLASFKEGITQVVNHKS